MSIKKDVYIPVLQGKTRTVNSKGKNELSDATNEVLDKIYFRVIDNNRKVNVGTTALLIYEIKKWLKSYKEKIIPNTLEPTNPSLEKEKNKIYRDTIAWVEKWEHWKETLIPENRGVIGGVDLEVDRFHFVKLNDELLNPNKLLTHNQALFLLLGLNAIALENELADFPTFTDTRPKGRYAQFDFIFWDTPQNKALQQSAFFRDDGKITSENLLKLAEEYGFFTTPKQSNKKTEQKDKNIEIVKPVLVDFLDGSRLKGKYNINALKDSTTLTNTLKDGGLIIVETGIDANKKTSDRKPNEITSKTLGVYLKELFESSWWTGQDKSIRDKVEKYQ
jgi:hypothetical protein